MRSSDHHAMSGKDWKTFYTPGLKSCSAETTEDVLERTAAGPERPRDASPHAARERTMAEHTAAHRAAQMESLSGERRPNGQGGRTMWGVIPAAGKGSRIQPLAFSKELLPVGSRLDQGTERPLAVSEYLVERMIAGGANRICFVVSPGKTDILEYYGSRDLFGRCVLYGADAASGIVRCTVPCAAVHRRRRAGSVWSAGHRLVPGGGLHFPCGRCPFIPAVSCGPAGVL